MYKIEDLFNKINEKDLNGYLDIVYDILYNKNCEVTITKLDKSISSIIGKNSDLYNFGVDIDYIDTPNVTKTRKVPLVECYSCPKDSVFWWVFIGLFYGGREIHEIKSISVKTINRSIDKEYFDGYRCYNRQTIIIKIYNTNYVVIPTDKEIKSSEVHGVEYHSVRKFPKVIRERFCMTRMIDFTKDYDLLLEDVINGQLEFEYAFGIDRCTIKESKDLYRIVTSESFNSSKKVPMSREIRADRSMSQVILYHYQLLDDKTVLYINDLYTKGKYNGVRPISFFVKKLKKKMKEENITNFSDSIKLLLEISE